MKYLHAIPAHARHWWSSPVVRVAVGAVVSAVFLALAFRAVPPDQMLATLRQASPLFVGLTLASIALNVLAKTVRWRVLLGGEGGRHVTIIDLLRALLVGQMLNTFIPTRVGDLSRAVAIGQRGPGTAFVLGTVVLEKLLDTLAFGVVLLLVVVLTPLPEWARGGAYQALLVGALVVIGVVVVYRRRVPRFVGEWVRHLARQRIAAKLVDASRSAWQSTDVLGRPAEVAKLVALSALVWASAVLNNVLMLWAFGIDLPLEAALLLLVGLQVGISLPTLPGTIGVFEYVCVVVLALWGVERTLAFSYGLLLHAVVMIPPMLVALLFLFLSRGACRPSSVPHH